MPDFNWNQGKLRASSAYTFNMNENEALTKFLQAWQSQDWQAMAEVTQLTWRSKQENSAEWLQGFYGPKRLEQFEVGTCEVISPTASRINCEVVYSLQSKGFASTKQTKTLKAMVIQEKAPYEPSEQGTWGVNPISTLKEGDDHSEKQAKAMLRKSL